MKGIPMRTPRNYGVSRIDVLVIVACAGLLVVITSAVLGQTRPEGGGRSQLHPRSLEDGTQLKEIQHVFVLFARQNKGRYPLPGLIDRLPDPHLGEVPGAGPEDAEQNTTANLYSALISQAYLLPDIVVSPIERNPSVEVDRDYNYDAYDPANDVYWDTSFVADLDRKSNTSYAHLVVYGKRKAGKWRCDKSGSWPVLGNRGPKDGKLDPASYTCGPHGHWAGNVVFNDNHTELLKTTKPKHVLFDSNGQKKQDNLFAFDDGVGGADAILTFTNRMTLDGPIIQHD